MDLNHLHEDTFDVNNDKMYTTEYLSDSLGRRHKILIFDDFYKNPDLVRNLCFKIPPTNNSSSISGFPGTRVACVLDMDELQNKIMNMITVNYSNVKNMRYDENKFLVNITKKTEDSVSRIKIPHMDIVGPDMRVFASSIYLNTEEEIGNNTYGTSFYKNIKINATHYNDIKNYEVYKKMYDISDEDDYQLLNRVKMKYNRCILYDGLLLHSIDKESFKKDIFKNTWRLNQMIFSVYEPQEIWN